MFEAIKYRSWKYKHAPCHNL